MFFLGCHLVDLILQIKGTPDNIIPLNRCTGMDGVTAQDFGMAVFEYKNGVSFAKTCAEELGGFERRQLVVCGSKGTVELKPLKTVACEGTDLLYTDERSYGTNDTWHTQGEFRRSDTFDRYESMLKAFAKMVRGEIKNPYTYEYELTLFETLMRCVDR
jgi:predicted dehydrogenase